MKNILYTLTLIWAACLLGSCKNEVEDYFDQTASERMEQEVVKYRELLVKPQHGWIMEYYPGGINQAFGGYAITVSFTTDGYAVFRSVLEDDVSKSVSSFYALNKDMGPTLNFDTYNELFHYFSNPDTSNGDGAGKGMLGDYEFIFDSGTENEIIMTGKKHKSTIRMYALQEPATEYLKKAKAEMESYFMIAAVNGLKGTFAGEPAEAEFITSQSYMLAQGKESTKFSFMFTDKGIKLYAPIELNGKKVENLSWDKQKRAFTTPDGQTNLALVYDPKGLREDQLLGNYVLHYENGKQIDVSIKKRNNGNIVMEGLPFNVKLSYNRRKGALELNAQQLRSNPEVWLAIWARKSSGGYLIWDKGYGLVTEWNEKEGDEFTLKWVDNGYEWFTKGERNYADSFILWEVGKGVYNGYGDARFYDLFLTKK
ncbi:hypothetical protein HMPREF1981_01317 [Bacteroides pyogenes F0041]|uniref:DUF4987 domain-containing protein n=1 Tax=Bacteroides pyogenes F0041 TaxID=1321819 RepID=U2CP42_9BACE|nr:DUF4302 domain-containing protein [Bacteroides pyogenes]ERI85833.1 hypothetical protein HMPREF1981_01317 [Bacteroides pyogenes F0041]